MTVNETNPISLSCDASGFPAPSIAWIKFGQVLPDNKQLNISSSGKSDAGEYMCTTSNGVGQPKTAKAYVTVQCESKFHNVIKFRDGGAWGPGGKAFASPPPPIYSEKNKDLLREESFHPPPPPPVKVTSKPPELRKCSAVPEVITLSYTLCYTLSFKSCFSQS